MPNSSKCVILCYEFCGMGSDKLSKGTSVDFAVCWHVYISVGKSKRYSAGGSVAMQQTNNHSSISCIDHTPMNLPNRSYEVERSHTEATSGNCSLVYQTDTLPIPDSVSMLYRVSADAQSRYCCWLTLTLAVKPSRFACTPSRLTG